jgi:hypothetical protein
MDPVNSPESAEVVEKITICSTPLNLPSTVLTWQRVYAKQGLPGSLPRRARLSHLTCCHPPPTPSAEKISQDPRAGED